MTMPNVPEQLNDAWTRLYRAMKIYDAFVNEVDTFMYNYVKGIVKGWDPETESYVLQFRYASDSKLKGKPLALVVDLLENLRAALDYMVFELSRLNIADFKEHTPLFVIADTKKDFDRLSEKRLRYLTDVQRTDFIEKLQPFHGNHILGLLRDLTGQSKHRRLLSVRDSSGWYITLAPAKEQEIHTGSFMFRMDHEQAFFAKPTGFTILLLEMYDALKTLKVLTEHLGDIVRLSHSFFEGRPFEIEIVPPRGWNEEPEFAPTHK